MEEIKDMSNFGKINTQLLGITASEIKEVDASDSEVISRQLILTERCLWCKAEGPC